MNKYLLLACDKNFHEKRFNIEKQAKKFKYFESIESVNLDLLVQSNFYKEHISILSQKKGAGYCLWKPLIILNLLNSINDNDCILYMDSEDIFINTPDQELDDYMTKNDILITSGSYKQSDYTKRDCFHFMDCDTEEYHSAFQIECGIICVKKTEKSIKLVQEWLYYACNENIITDAENICGKKNLHGFIDHRYDQSILTNLVVKYKIETTNLLRKYIKCNA
tara:strand:- start:1936 stop:2601 length:666 start_codon:yes stop_codon:yes gene_type:complete